MRAEQQTMPDRKAVEAGGPNGTPEPAVSPNAAGGVWAVAQNIVHNRPLQVGVAIAAAAGAGLLLVSLIGAGPAVAGVAGYLAYREMCGQRGA